MVEKKRRDAGEGSIYQRRDGKWVAQYKIETISGKKTKYRYAKTEREAKQKLREALAEVSKYGGQIVSDSGAMTVEQYLREWLENHKRNIKQNTYREYETTIRLHIIPVIGSKRLCKLNAFDVESLYSHKLSNGVSSHRVRYIHVTLHAALKRAVRLSLIATNPTDAVESPKTSREREIQPFNREQIAALLDAARGNRFEALYVLALTTGIRQGELLALQWSDIDFEAGTLAVCRTLYKGQTHSPKTASARRTIQLTRHAIEALQQHKEEHSGDGFIFCTYSGKPVSATNLVNKSWKPLLEKAGILYRNFHQCRHTVATLLLEQDVNPLLVSQLLGHADVAFTLRVYTHPNDEARAKTAQAMEDVLG